MLIRDICNTSSGGTPSRKVSEYFSTPPEGHPWLASRELTGGFVYDAEEHISQLGLDNSSAKIFPVNTVLLAMYGATAGKVGRLAIPMTTSQAICGMVAKQGVCHQGFLYYLIKNESWKIVWKNALGGAQPNISQFSIKNHPIKLPDSASQDKIYDHLNAIDALIENQQKQIQVLETIINSLFRSWFIDFEPVKAKSEGNLPSSIDEETLTLFPDSFEDSDLGLIPKGWKITSLHNELEFALGGDWGSENHSLDNPIKCRCVRGADIENLQNHTVSNLPERYLSEDSFKKRQLREGDIIFEISGGSTNQSTGRTTIITDHILNAYDTPLVYSNFCRILRFRDMQNSIYHYLKLTTCYNNDEFFAWEVGTTAIKNFPFTFFSKNVSIIMPPQEILKSFFMVIESLLIKNGQLMHRHQSLIELRDFLLPRLMSGELKVPMEA